MKSLELPPGRSPVAEYVPTLHQVVDLLSEQWLGKSTAQQKPPSCRAGCHACCSMLVMISAAEASALLRLVKSLPQGQQERLQLRFEEQRAQLSQAGLLDALECYSVLPEATQQGLATQYRRLSIPCAFLENGLCGVYESRPLACRRHWVSSPSQYCEENGADQVQRISIPAVAEEMAERLPAGVPAWLPLSNLLHWAEQGNEIAEEISAAEFLSLTGLGRRVVQDPTRFVVADFAPPEAVMLPFLVGVYDELFSRMASALSEHTGVILLTSDPEAAESFVATHASPESFRIVVSEFDTPWIRDRAPIAVNDKSKIKWWLPRLPNLQRPLDDVLFNRISNIKCETLPINISGGNLVSDGEGLALSSERLLKENGFTSTVSLRYTASLLGIREWIIHPEFEFEQTGHSDVFVRFLRRDLAAIAVSKTSDYDHAVAMRIAELLRQARSEIEIIELPMRSEGKAYASPVNWIQCGNVLFVPAYEIQTDEDRTVIRQALKVKGFAVTFLNSPTLDVAGSLHCLTASIYVRS